MSDEKAGEEIFDEFVEVEEIDDDGDGTAEEAGAPGQYGVGPFTIREVAILGAWLIAFVVSFFPAYATPLSLLAAAVAGDAPNSVWTSGIDWVLTIGLPTAAVFLIALRRFSPQGIRRVGSLGVDQFASVAFSVSAVVWLSQLWSSITVAAQFQIWTTTWVIWVEVVLALALVVLSVFAPFIPPFSEDFRGRPEEVAHRNARQVVPVVPRPVRERPVVVEPVPSSADETGAFEPAPFAPAATSAGAAPAPATEDPYASAASNETDAFAPFESVLPADATPATESGTYARGGAPEPAVEDRSEWAAPAPSYARSANPEPAPVVSHQPFWALVPVEREIYDEQTGAPLFRIGPTAWALVVADRGSSFLVRHDDGRVGVLYDVTGVTRG